MTDTREVARRINDMEIRAHRLWSEQYADRPANKDAFTPDITQAMVKFHVAEQASSTGDLVEALRLHKLDTDRQVFFYEQEFYVLSNFSAFTLAWKGLSFDTSEAAYHWEKFPGNEDLQHAIYCSLSAHEAFKLAEAHKAERRPDWDDVKVEIMRHILTEKAKQHEYVRRKLLETGDRELVEDSWRDDFWGWGPNKDGKNMLGRLWMEVRAALLAAQEKKA